MTDDNPTDPAPDPEARLSPTESASADETPVHDPETGELRGTVTGLKAFQEHWAHDVEMPHQMSFSGWQMVDEEHPAEGGKPAYRLVHKTIRTVPFPFLDIQLERIKVLVGNGEVTVGAPVFSSALPARREGEFLVPEWGQVVENPDGSHGYQHAPDPRIGMHAWQETFPPGNFVEILCLLPEDVGDTHAQQVAAGRAATAPMRAMLDLDVTGEVGSLYSIRNKLLHGKLLSVADAEVARVRALAVALLEEHAFGEVSPTRATELREALGLPGPEPSPSAASPD